MINVKKFGASGSRRQFAVSAQADSPIIAFSTDHDFSGRSQSFPPSDDGHGILLQHAGPDQGLPAPTLSVSGAGGSATYSYSVAALTPNGGHSAASEKISSPGFGTLSWNSISGAGAYAIYDSNDNLIALVSGLENSWQDKGAAPRDKQGPAMPNRPRTLMWRPNQTYNVGEWVLPETPNGRAYQCIAARADRISGTHAPSWPLGPGEEVYDKHLLWAESQLTVPLLAPASSGRDWLRTRVVSVLQNQLLVLADNSSATGDFRAIHDDFDALKRAFTEQEHAVYVPTGDYNIVVGGEDDPRFSGHLGPAGPNRKALLDARDISFEWRMHPGAKIRIMSGMIPCSSDKSNSLLYVFHFFRTDRVAMSGGTWQWLPNGGVLLEKMPQAYNSMDFCYGEAGLGNEDHVYDRVTWDGVVRWGEIAGPSYSSRGDTHQSRCVFRDCKVLNFGGGGNDGLAYMQGGAYWFDRCFIQSNRSFSSHFFYSAPHAGPDFRIINCELNQCGKEAIHIYAEGGSYPPDKNLLVSGCSFRNIVGNSILVDPGGGVFSAGIQIENCNFRNAGPVFFNRFVIGGNIANCIWYEPAQAIIINQCESIQVTNCQFLLPRRFGAQEHYFVVTFEGSVRCSLSHNNWSTETMMPSWFDRGAPAPLPDPHAKMIKISECADIKAPYNRISGHLADYPVEINRCDRLDMPYLSIRSGQAANFYGIFVTNSSDVCLDHLDCTHTGLNPHLKHTTVSAPERPADFQGVSVAGNDATFKVTSPHHFRVGQQIRSKCDAGGSGWKAENDFSFGRITATTSDSVSVYYFGTGITDPNASGKLIDNVGITAHYSKLSHIDAFSGLSTINLNQNPPAIEFLGVGVDNSKQQAIFTIPSGFHGLQIGDRVSSRELADGSYWRHSAGHDFEYALVVGVTPSTVCVRYNRSNGGGQTDLKARGVLIPNRSRIIGYPS